jgi:Tol biopolymer transport system component
MPDVQEIFRMSTQKVDQAPGALQRQIDRRRRADRNRKAGAFTLVAAIVVVAVAAALILRSGPTDTVPVSITDCTERVGAVSTMGVLDLASCEFTSFEGLPELPYPRIFQVSDDGSKVAFVGLPAGETYATQIYVMNIDGSGLERVTDDLEAFGPAWSPDGTRIVYTGFRNDGEATRDLYILDLETRGVERLTHGNALDEQYPDWSPDGTSVVFTAPPYGSPATTGIYRVDVASQEVERLSVGRDFVPRYSPDGTTLAFDRGEPIRDLWVSDADATDAEPVLDAEVSEEFPAWSPDGTRLLYTEIDADRSYADLHVLDLLTSETRLVLRGVFAAAWLPDGNRIVVMPA